MILHSKNLQESNKNGSNLQTLTVNGTRPILGKFSKALDGARSLSFGRSGGRNCPKQCPYHPASSSPYAAAIGARCYAANCENRPDRSQLAAKLDRAEVADGDTVLRGAAGELDRRGWRLPWFRFSTFGSVPSKCTPVFRRFTARLADAGTPVHLPVFSSEQASEYRRGLDGLAVTVRESVPVQEFHSKAGAVSCVVGSMTDKPLERLRLAKMATKSRRAFVGRRCIICPAIAATVKRTGSKRAKCGACTACANGGVDVVYPAHR